MERTSRTARIVLVALLAVMLTVGVASPAFALTSAKVTVDEETGGQPTRFTVVVQTDKDAAISSMDLMFPTGFDLTNMKLTGPDPTKYDYDVVTLEGLRRVKNAPTGTVKGETLSVAFDPAIAPDSSLRIQIRNVDTPIKGGTYALKVSYTAETTGTAGSGSVTRTDDTMRFSYLTPPTAEVISRWMDKQPAITSWNSIKALGMFFKPQLLVTSTPLLFAGWLMALAMVGLGFPLAIVGGLAISFMKMSKIAPVRWISAIYINVIRGTPLFLQIFVVFIGLRIAGFRASDFVSAVAVLAINSSAYLAEIFRAGIQSISKGQFEAASSLGMTYRQSMQYVIIPQTVKRVLPTMTSEFILLFKDTALFAAIGIFELMMYANNYVARVANLTPYVVAAGYYLIITIPLINMVGMLEAKLAQSEHGQAPPDNKKRRGFFGPLALSVDPYRAGASIAGDADAIGETSDKGWRP
ncbi:MAG: ABC transporter permease subunit [Coriobacteriia bacterium]|nr:ABC transporter permease subunit [Coriobacteriia bacterium]